MNDEELDPVNVGSVVREIKQLGRFALLDRDGCHYVFTEYFAIQLRESDAWKIQCKLEVKSRGKWYMKDTHDWQEAPNQGNTEKMLEKFLSMISQAGQSGEETTPTGVAIETYEDAYVGGVLYVGQSGFTCVRSNYLTMLPDRKIVTRVGDMAVVNRMAVLTLMQDEVWSKNPWIMNYKGGES